MSIIKLKICGVKSIDEAKSLRDQGIDLVGLNFIPSSSHYIDIDLAEAILAEFRGTGIQSVALFAGAPLTQVNAYANRLKIDYVQLHGNEPEDYARAVEGSVIRAIAIHPEQTAAEVQSFIQAFPADYFILDRQRQGRGDRVKLDFAHQIVVAYPTTIFLAGGLSPDNLAHTLKQVKPYGIDISSGVRNQDDTLSITKVIECQKIIRSND
jgi:phosphoribosylanthranilate isomerase